MISSQSIVLFSFTLAVWASCVPQNTCKAYPGTPSWPSVDQWNTLNDTLSGKLIAPMAPGGVCHEGQANYDEDKCSALQDDWKTFDWHAGNPVSVMADNWANWTCLPDPELPCSVEGYPSYVVNASTAEHVKAGIDFARENNVRLVVKSTGHDFLGRSVAPGSLSIWVHYLNTMTYHSESFTLDSDNALVIPGDAVTAGGGAQMYDLYSLTDKHNATVVGGGAKSVSVGGYITGGGHSMFSPDYGLAADNVLQMEVVTPAGEVLVVNEEQNEDLFWALRGGGGSTFGVITSVTMKTHPSPKVQHAIWFAGTLANATRAHELVGWLLAQAPGLSDRGIRGYNFVSTKNAVPIPVPGLPPNLAGFSGSSAVFDQAPGTLQAALDELNANMTSRFNESSLFSIIKTYDSWLEWFDVNYDSGEAGQSAILQSTLLSRESLTADSDALVDAIVSASNLTDGLQFFPLSGKGVQEAVPRGGSNAVNPGWRKALVHCLSGYPVPRFDEAAELEVAATLDRDWQALRALNPGLGAYINEASAFEPEYQRVFWGDNYDRLLDIKRRVDPNDVFWCSPCVGNERWAERADGKLCEI